MKKLLNIIALIGTIAVNAAANIVEFNGVSTAQVSDMFPVFFVPAGYVFSIWGVIYLALGVFVAYQAIALEENDKRLSFITPLFLLGSVANTAWIFFWHYGIIPGSLVMMLVLLFSLIMIYAYLRDIAGVGKHSIERWTVMLPFSIYLGWICVATIANVSVYLFDIGWGGGFLTPQQWASIMIVVAGLFGVVFAFKYHDVAFNLVLIWAILGIMIKFIDVSTIFTTCIFVLCMLFFVTFRSTVVLYRKHQGLA